MIGITKKPYNSNSGILQYPLSSNRILGNIEIVFIFSQKICYMCG